MSNFDVKENSSIVQGNTMANAAKIPGLHMMGDFYGCRCAPELLWQIKPVKRNCLRFVEKVGLNAVGHKFHKFEGGGVTGMVVLAESHMSVHTWPEHGHVTVDVYVCSYTEDNRPNARKLYRLLTDLFLPAKENSREVERL